MRNAMLAILALSAAGAATVAGSSAPAAAYDYPYCIQGRGYRHPGDCSYSTYGQCMASASGRGAVLQRQSARRLRPAAAARPARIGYYFGIPEYRNGVEPAIVVALEYVMQRRLDGSFARYTKPYG